MEKLDKGIEKEIKEEKIITDEFVEKYKNKKVNWGFNGLGYIVYKRTYSRLKEDNTGENWTETIQRCINGSQKIGAQYTKEEAERLFDLIFNLKCTFPGRMLWQLGTLTVNRFWGNSLINCYFCTINEPKAFEFLFENLMLGGGVGFSIRREHIHELPKVKSGVNIIHENTKDADIIVPDSRKGWVRLLHSVLKSFFETGKSFTYSTILVRGAGEPIKTFGGTASGPKILTDGITNICKVFQSREGKKLRSIDVLDVCNIIGSIVVAGNLRRSAEISLGDPDDYLFLRAKRWDLGNVPNWRSMSNNSLYIDDFPHISNDVWEGYTGNGECYGFFNLPLSQKYGRLGEKVNDNKIQGLNPCVAPETLIFTKDGHKIISTLENKEIEIWNGKEWSTVVVKKTGVSQKLIRVILKDGSYLDCTEYHKFYVDLDDWVFSSVEGESKNSSIIEVLAKNLKPGQLVKKFNNSHTNDYLYFNLIGIQEIIDIQRTSDTYCVNEPLEHKAIFNGILTGQCGEIGLENYEVCNLSELFLNNISSKEELIDCAKLLYKTQKAVSSLPFIHDETNEVVHRNMRLGLSVTGICQSFDKIEWLDDCYKELKKFDKEWSKKRGWPESVKLTAIKPSGSVSLLSGATPGIHPSFSKYYIRRIRLGSNDPLVNICRNSGYHTEYVKNFDGTEDRNTIVIEFPCEAGERAKTAKDMTAVDQLELVKKIQTVWADNAVSASIYYSLEELQSIKDWLKKNYKQFIKSISFLLRKDSGFEQMPYEEITKERYKELLKNIKPINDIKDSGEIIDELECSSGACPIR